MAVAAALAFTLVADPAAAQQGRLYEPFPDALDEERIGDFVAGAPGGASLAPELSAERLDRGAFVTGQGTTLRWPAPPAATERAVPAGRLAPGPAGIPREFGWALGAALVVLALGGAAALAGRAEPGRRHA
jgi:hypothetical protein